MSFLLFGEQRVLILKQSFQKSICYENNFYHRKYYEMNCPHIFLLIIAHSCLIFLLKRLEFEGGVWCACNTVTRAYILKFKYVYILYYLRHFFNWHEAVEWILLQVILRISFLYSSTRRQLIHGWENKT